MELLVIILLGFLILIFNITMKNKSETTTEELKEEIEEYTIDDLIETLNFLVEHQIITPTEYNMFIVKASQYL